jgi:hypothetical protein
MRVVKFVALMIILLETILILAFWGGTIWIGGWKGGVILLSGALIFLILPWIGNLEVEYDVIRGYANIRLGWFGRILIEGAPDRESRFHFLFFRWRNHSGSGKRSSNRKRQNESEMKLNPESVSRSVLALLLGINEMIWEADKISLKLQAPTQIDGIDQILAKFLGRRLFGPLYLTVLEEGEREIVIRFKIGLLKGFLIGLSAFVQGRPLQMWRPAKE